MSNKTSIVFKGKSFCFTGEMNDIRRSDAEKEVGLRGAYPSKSVNKNLDYLVIGSIPNPDWKFGNYGNKINSAIKLRNEIGKPKIINESDFIDALILSEPISLSIVKEKMLFIRFNFLAKFNDPCLSDVEFNIDELKKRYTLYSTKSEYDLSGQVSLFDIDAGSYKNEDVLKVEYRLLKHIKTTDSTTEIINQVMSNLNSIKGISGNFSFSEPTEGTSIFMRLLQEISSSKT